MAQLAALSISTADAYRQETDLAINIRKATSVEETAPKRKHVRSCIVYTWDHKNSNSFWQGMKVYVASQSSPNGCDSTEHVA